MKEFSLCEAAGTYPHLLAALEFHAALGALRALRFRKPLKIPVGPLIGLVVEPPPWGDVLGFLGHALEAAEDGSPGVAFHGLGSRYEARANLSEVEL